MTTMELPSVREYTFMRLARMAKTRNRNRTLNMNALLGGIVRLVLHLAGFALLTVMGFEINTIAGYGFAGASCFILATLMSGESEDKRGS